MLNKFTKISLPNGEKKLINEIEMCEEILGENGEKIKANLFFHNSIRCKMVEIHTEDGDNIMVTPNQKIKVYDKDEEGEVFAWKRSKYLKENDILVKENGKHSKISKIVNTSYSGWTYNISNDAYYANNYCLKN